jgi:hypothetical protein
VVCGLEISFLPQMNTNINVAPVTLAKTLPMGRSNGMKALSKFIIGYQNRNLPKGNPVGKCAQALRRARSLGFR